MTDIHSFEPLFGDWYVESILGKGSYGNVYKAKRSENGTTYYSAIKHISIEDGDDYSADVQAKHFSREINISQQFNGEPNFASYEDSTFVNSPMTTALMFSFTWSF